LARQNLNRHRPIKILIEREWVVSRLNPMRCVLAELGRANAISKHEQSVVFMVQREIAPIFARRLT
jgi:hypothetical protein